MAESLKDENRERAFAVYKQHHRLQQVCDVLGIGYATAFRWRAEGNWDERITTEALLPTVPNPDGSQLLIPAISPQEIQEKIDAERLQLDVLEMRSLSVIALENLRPKQWKDILATLRYVAERRDILIEKIARLALSAKKATSTVLDDSLPESILPLSIEQQEHLDSLLDLVNASRQQLTAVEQTIQTTPPPDDNMPPKVETALAEVGLSLKGEV